MRLRAADTDGPRGLDRTSTPIRYGDPTRLKSPPLVILWKAQTAGARVRPRVNGGNQRMSNNLDTRGSVILGVCQHDPDRWSEFDSIYRPMLIGFLRKQGLNEFDASDVVQDIFVKLLGKIQTYDREQCKFRTWLFAVAHHTLVDYARRRATQKKALDGWAANMLRASASDSLKMAEEWVKLHRAEILRHALKRVRSRTSPKSWACFEQRLLRDRPGIEIAAELGIEASTVFVNACRVLKRVRAVCQEFDEDMSDGFDSSLSRRD
jgi:RNA polymerase sigma-70 factor, ECF subfamily